MEMEENSMDKIVQDHEQRIISLEESRIETNEAVQTIQKENESNRHSMLKLENTVLNSNKEQKELLHKLIDNVIESNKTDKANEYKLKESEQELKKENQKNKWDLTLKLIQSGGILFLLAEYFISK
jgi:hypothetical protein